MVVIAYKTYCGNEHSASLHLQCFFVKSWKLSQRTRLMKCSDTWLKTTSTKWLSWTWDKINVLGHKILCLDLFREVRPTICGREEQLHLKKPYIIRSRYLTEVDPASEHCFNTHLEWPFDCPWTCFKISHIWLEYPVMLCFSITTPTSPIPLCKCCFRFRIAFLIGKSLFKDHCKLNSPRPLAPQFG